MSWLRRRWPWVAAAAATTAVAVPLGLTSGTGKVDVYVGSTPTAGTCTSSTPSVCGFPDATNTGVPSGTTLTAYTGPSTITTANTTVDSKTMGCITIRAANVTIKNSKILCADPIYVVDVDDDVGVSPIGVTLLDDEIACVTGGLAGTPHAGPGTALGDAFITARRINLYGCENAGDVNQEFDIQDSYIHDLYEDPLAGGDGTHTDGFQFASAHFNGGGGASIAGVNNVTLTHNTILSMGTNGTSTTLQFTTSAIISNGGGIDHNVLIQNNFLAGGGYTLNCEKGGTQGVNYRVLDNHFSRTFATTVGAFGPSTECADETQSGNVIHETGAPYALE